MPPALMVAPRKPADRAASRDISRCLTAVGMSPGDAVLRSIAKDALVPSSNCRNVQPLDMRHPASRLGIVFA